MKGKTETRNVESSSSTKKKIEEVFKEYPLHSAPHDKDGFIQSFNVDDVNGLKKFFDEYGFVVVDGILNEEEIKETLDEVWTILENTKWGVKSEKVNRNDPRTWEDDRWPMAVRSLGILGYDPASTKRAWMNRQNEKLYKVFSVLMNKKELWASVDRYGIMRPTKNVPIGKLKQDGTRELEDRPDWKTVPAWLHWDLNPYKWIGAQEGIEYEFEDFIIENNGSKNDGLLKLQGLIALTESRDEDGGFCTVSGFHKHLPEWCKLTADTDYAARTKNTFDFVSAPKGDPMFQQIQNIACRAGSLIVWRGEQPHCNYPNNSNRFRINQYIKCFPAQPKGKGVEMRKEVIRNMIPEDVKITKLGEKLFGLKDW